MYSWGVGTPQSDPNLKKKNFFLIKALRWFLILFLYFVHFVVATKVFGMQHFSLSLSLSMYVLHMCEYSWFQKHALFYFLSFTVGNWVCCTHCWLSPQHLLPSPSSAVPDFHLGIWGSRDADSTSISRSCHHSAGKSCLWLFLFSFRVKKNKKQKNNKVVILVLQGLTQWGPVIQPHLLQPPTHLCSFLLPPLTLPETFQALLYLPIFSHL